MVLALEVIVNHNKEEQFTSCGQEAEKRQTGMSQREL
jgi:hypothetical protein